MKILVLICSVLFLIGCATGITKNEISLGFEQNASKFNSTKFAFVDSSSMYYFASVELRDGKSKCDLYVGYKNDKFKYFFSPHRLKELREVYNEDQSIEQKISKTINKINTFENVKESCISENMGGKEAFADNLLTLLGWSPLLIVASPLYIEPAIKGIQKKMKQGVVNKLRLGMSLEQVKKILSKKLHIRKSKSYTDYYLDTGDYRLVLYVENNKLFAMVYGLHTPNTK